MILMVPLWALRPPGRRLPKRRHAFRSFATPRLTAITSPPFLAYIQRAIQKPSIDMITAHQADPTEDLRRERSQASFPSRELAALMAGGEAQLKLRERIADAVRADPVFSKKGKYFMERADLYRTTLEKYLALPRLATAIDPNDPITVGKIIRELIDEPGGLDLHAVDVTTLHCFVNANLYDTMTEDLDGGFEVLWVFPSGSRGAARYRAGLSPGSHIMMVGVGPGGENICAPDRATAIAFLGRRPGFVTMTEEIGEETLLLWIFREGSAEAAAARAGMRPLRSVSRIGVGPAGISLRAPDVATLDAYMALL